MRILVMGASGMLGHKVYQTLAATDHQVFGALRRPVGEFDEYDIFELSSVIEGVDVRIPETIEQAFLEARPEVVINCVGLIKSLAKDPTLAIELNSLLPQRLAKYCDLTGARLVQISTDCVFSGRDGRYTEESVPDPEDLYGRTKLLGEVVSPTHLTIRTSIIGRELGTKRNLVEWILSQRGEANGFANAWFSGLTTRALSRVLVSLVERGGVNGLLHVAGERVNKYNLLGMVVRHFGLDLKVNRYEDFHSDRSLAAGPFGALGIVVPRMDDMMAEMAAEDGMYQNATVAMSGAS